MDDCKNVNKTYVFQAGIVGDRFELVLEPEAASAFCKCLPIERLAGVQSKSLDCFRAGVCYIVLDLGGK